MTNDANFFSNVHNPDNPIYLQMTRRLKLVGKVKVLCFVNCSCEVQDIQLHNAFCTLHLIGSLIAIKHVTERYGAKDKILRKTFDCNYRMRKNVVQVENIEIKMQLVLSKKEYQIIRPTNASF